MERCLQSRNTGLRFGRGESTIPYHGTYINPTGPSIFDTPKTLVCGYLHVTDNWQKRGQLFTSASFFPYLHGQAISPTHQPKSIRRSTLAKLIIKNEAKIYVFPSVLAIKIYKAALSCVAKACCFSGQHVTIQKKFAQNSRKSLRGSSCLPIILELDNKLRVKGPLKFETLYTQCATLHRSEVSMSD